MKKLKRIISLFLTVVLLSGIITVAPVSVSAAEKQTETSAAKSDSTAETQSYTVDMDSLIQSETEPTTESATNPTVPPETVPPKTAGDPVAAVEEITSGDFTYTTIDDKVYITSYTGTETEVVFPAEIDGKAVYGIDPNGRTNCVPNAKVTKVTVSEGIESLGSCTFRSANVLTDISLPSTLTSIADHCFIWCYALQKIALPENLKRLGARCFFDDTGLKSITLPKSLEALEEGIFINCHSLGKVVFPENVKYNTIPQHFLNGCRSLTSVNIPEQIETIGNYAFQQCYLLKNITLPNGLKTICNSAFIESGLETLIVPKSVQIIGEHAFTYTKVSKVTVLCENATIGIGAFSGCESLVEAELSEGITDIGAQSFYYCVKLSKIKIPRGVTELKYDVFKDCKNLETVEVHDKLTKIGGFTFAGCGKLASFDFTHITELGDRTFENCGFKELKIPGTLKNLGSFAFHWCRELESAELGDGIEVIRGPFAECSALKSVKMPSTLKKIAGGSDFNCCSALQAIDLPHGLEEIASYAFDRTPLKSITIPDSVTKLGEGIFLSCGALESVTLPKELKTIPDGIFNYCSSLNSISIPDTVTTIGNYAFSHTGLERFDGNKDLISIEDNAFSSCASLKQVTMQDSVTSIGESAFSSSGIEEIALSKNLKTISRDAFYNCNSLKSITIPQGVTRIEVGVFSYCRSLADVYAHDNINYIFPGGWQNSAAFAESPNAVIHCPNKYSVTARTAVNSNCSFDFDLVGRDGDYTEIIDTEKSSYYINSGSMKSLVCNYAFKDEVYQGAENKNVLIHMPVGMEITASRFYVDGQKTTNYKYDSISRVYTIPVSEQSGRIVMYIANEDNSYDLRTYAALQCKTNGKTVTETIDLYNEFVGSMNISAGNTTSDGSVKVTGSGPKSTTVSFYVDNTLCATANTNKVGSFTADISIPNPVNTMTYAIEARAVNASGKQVSATAYTQYIRSAPKLTGFWLAPNKKSTGTQTFDLLNPNSKLRLVPGTIENYHFALKFDNAEGIEKVVLSSTKDGKTANYNVKWNENQKMFVSGTILLDYDKNTEFYPPPVMGKNVPVWLDNLPGRLSIAIETKPVEFEVNYNSANAFAEKVKTISNETQYITSSRITNKTEKSADIEINTKDGTVNSHFDAGPAGEFIKNHPDIAGYTGNGTISGGLTDFSDNAIPGTEASANPQISDIGKNMTEGQLIDNVKKNWALTPTPNGNIYTNASISDSGVNFCSFNPVNGQFACNAMAFGSNFVGLAAGRSASGFISGVTGVAGFGIGVGASLIQNISYLQNQKGLGDALYNQIMNCIDDPVNQQLAKNAWLKMQILSALGALSSIAGDILIAAGFAGFWLNPWLGAGLIAVGIGINLFSGWLNEKSNEQYRNVLSYLYNRTPITWVIDPSGYVYAGLESNRLMGATATVYGIIQDDETDDATFWDKPDESRQVKWNAVEYDQINPQTTDYYGFYQWDVPIGWWRVEIKAEGYETYTTEWMKVPPPQLDVNIGLTSKSKPEIISAEKAEGGYVLVFKDCMKPDSVKNLVLTDSSGSNVNYTLEFEDEQSPTGEKLAKEYKLKISSDSQSDTYSLSISNAENYSGIKGDVSYSIKTNNEKLSNVTASVESGEVNRGTKITLSCSEANAEIYYTLDGSDPTKDDSYALRYTEPITINDDAEIKAYAVCDGYTDSDVSVFSYSVTKYLIGDINSDGKVNGADAGILSRYVAGWSGYADKIKNMVAADINKDGKVNGADAGMLSRYTSGWTKYASYFE